ncbi:hypothetical protein CONCODRAFT_132287 [Conidiobolus coronatus NRRL 28638]|uniref:Uncharacterized protein n=1 Tax=Conidiobolus coronatus (strain ATCC 28846 / CBS 209.66 / NRRL 28638) TaxID=796925 RepID=A0A137NTP5_CONC2|nr:hypothetical protein CONCODRAFT_132287 [Conidiobolus coronatus NRRL 28638]|eukprot:KXN66109.1 hypothetical protein CONCODRAFT_132287 [Conidiobolus coronatus NRRL 28638]
MSKTPPNNIKANTTFNGNSNKSIIKSQLKSLNSTKKLTITIISEFNWCTINLSEILLKFCLNLPKNFTLAQLTLKCLTTIENIYYLKNVKLSRFRDSNGYDIVSDYKAINQENTFYVAILDAEDNKQTQLDRFKESLIHNNSNINIHKSFQVLDLPNQSKLA